MNPANFRIRCDDDGWALQANEEPTYPYYLHTFPLTDVKSLEVQGDIKLRLINHIAFNKSEVRVLNLSFYQSNDPWKNYLY